MSVAQRNTAFSILKAFAIILVVIGHSGAPHYVNAFAYMQHVPIFFICAGYFFTPRSLEQGGHYLRQRVRKIYFPFLRWSIAFLVLHNLWYFLGVYSSVGVNGVGAIAPYTFHDFSQRLWSIVFNMSGYDEQLAGTFWFFRAFFLVSLAYWVLQKMLSRFSYFSSPVRVNVTIVAIAWGMALWLVLDNLRITGVAQGGYRELTGLFFFAVGGVYRVFESRISLSWKYLLAYAVLLVLATVYWHSAMKHTATWQEFLALPLPAVIGFLFFLGISKWIDTREGMVRRGLIYIGDNTLYIFAFHFLAFKVVSALRIAIEGRAWQEWASHPVLRVSEGIDLYFILYTFVGVGLPLLVRELWRRSTASIHVPYDTIVTFVMKVIALIGKKILYAVQHSGEWLKALGQTLQKIFRLLREAFNSEHE